MHTDTSIAVSSPRLIENLPIWETIRIGTLKTLEEYVAALRAARLTANTRQAGFALSAMPCTGVERDLDLVQVEVTDLGFSDANPRYFPKYTELYEASRAAGLELCPAEVGPALLLQHKPSAPTDFHFRIAMEPIEVRRGGLVYEYLFDMEYFEETLYLDSGRVSCNIRSPMQGAMPLVSARAHNTLFLFVKPRK